MATTRSSKPKYAKLDAGMKYLTDFKGARSSPHPADRVREVSKRAKAFREKLLAGDQVLYYRSFDLLRVPYPTKFGFLNGYSGINPFMHIMNRLFIVQYKNLSGRVKTLLFSPSDYRRNAETPFFKRLGQMAGPFAGITEKFLAPQYTTVDQCLADIGLAREDIDYISYDHLHTQDVRRWLGSSSTGEAGEFPNAKLLVMRQEWESTMDLAPPQLDWYCPNGIAGINPAKVVLLDGDLHLGRGVALISTPGHTEGNHSLVAHTPEGVMVTSENGVSADSYAPLHSRIGGVRKYAKASGMEIILNGNTLEGGLDQYISMIQERDMAGPSTRNPDFYNFVPSSELTAYWGFPGLKPTFTFGPLEFGSLQNVTAAPATGGRARKVAGAA